MAQHLSTSAASVGHKDDTAAAVVQSPRAARSSPLRRVAAPTSTPTPATLRLYAADWACFLAWCRGEGHMPLPAAPATVAAFLVAFAPGLSRGALGRRRAAIAVMHRQAGLPVPVLHAATHRQLRTRARPRGSSRSASPTGAALLALAGRCPRDLAGLRDRALLLLAAALSQPGRPTEVDLPAAMLAGSTAEPVPRQCLLALDAEHVRFTTGGMTLQVFNRLDEAEPSRVVALARVRAAEACPVRAMEDWLRASGTDFGPVFRKVDRWNNVEHTRLHPNAWTRIVTRRSAAPRRLRAPEPKAG